MHDQIQQLLKNQDRDGQKVPLSHLRHAKTKKQTQRKMDQQIQIEDKSKNKPKHITGPSDTLFTYYCSLCGRLCLMCNSTLQSMPKRRTDNSIAINFQTNFVKLNLQRQRIKYFKRQNILQSATENGIEVQYRWKCECGIPVGYTSITYELFEQARQNQSLQINNKPYFYCFSDGLVEKMKESKLISQLITYKQTILLHLKRKTKK